MQAIESTRTTPCQDQDTDSRSNPRFTADQLGFMQLADTIVLAAVARGELDLNRLACAELVARGLDEHGIWIGFEAARARWASTTDRPAGDSVETAD